MTSVHHLIIRQSFPYYALFRQQLNATKIILSNNAALIARKRRFYLNTLKRPAIFDNRDVEGTAKLTRLLFPSYGDSNTTWTEEVSAEMI